MSLLDVHPLGLCLDCNYALLPGLRDARCPECGRPFDPGDRGTVNLGKPLSSAARWALGPVSWKVLALVGIAAGYSLWIARLPQTGRGAAAQLGIWSIVALLWLGWPVLRWGLARRNGWRLSMVSAGRRSRWWVGLLLFALIAAMWLELPMKAAMALSRGDMDSLAWQLMVNRKLAPRDQWIGLYKAKSIRRVPGGVRITVRDGDGYDAGFIYLPDLVQTRITRSSYQSVGGGWWTWYEEVP